MSAVPRPLPSWVSAGREAHQCAIELREQTICSRRFIEDLAASLTGDSIRQAEDLAATLRIAIVPATMPESTPALLLPPGYGLDLVQPVLPSFKPKQVMLVRRSRRSWFVLLILHELAHYLLMRSGARHLHGDVWALTLCLAAPRSVVRQAYAEMRIKRLTAGRLALLIPTPSWTAEARISLWIADP